MHQIAVQIAQQLHFDVPGPPNVFFDEHVAVAEGRRRFALGRFHVAGQFVGRVDHAHSAAAAAVRRFQHDRITEFRSATCARFVDAGNRIRAAAENRHLRLIGNFAGRRFVAQLVQQLRARPDET